jgi:hypothetical protein
MRMRHSPCLAVDSIRFHWGAYFGITPLVLALWLSGCPSPHPTLQATNQTTQTGGSLQITGTGFNLGDPVTLKIENVPGIGTWSSSAGKTTDKGGTLPAGSISVTVSYSLNPYSTLPGCRSGNSPDYYATLSITATASEDDGSSYGTPPDQLQVVNCGWNNVYVSTHQ